MPENAVSVTRPSRWGNPFKVGYHYERDRSFRRAYAHWLSCGDVTAENCLPLFEAYCWNMGSEWLEPLRGKDLACFCSLSSPCHADVLLRLANS